MTISLVLFSVVIVLVTGIAISQSTLGYNPGMQVLGYNQQDQYSATTGYGQQYVQNTQSGYGNNNTAYQMSMNSDGTNNVSYSKFSFNNGQCYYANNQLHDNGSVRPLTANEQLQLNLFEQQMAQYSTQLDQSINSFLENLFKYTNGRVNFSQSASPQYDQSGHQYDQGSQYSHGYRIQYQGPQNQFDISQQFGQFSTEGYEQNQPYGYQQQNQQYASNGNQYGNNGNQFGSNPQYDQVQDRTLQGYGDSAEEDQNNQNQYSQGQNQQYGSDSAYQSSQIASSIFVPSMPQIPCFCSVC